MSKKSRCSIIIPSFNNRALLERCIRSIQLHSTEINPEIVVVDNRSDAETIHFLKNLGHSIRLILNSENLGFAKACNIGAHQAEGDALLFLNNDTEVSEAWLQPLLEDLQDPSIGIAGNKLLYGDGLIQHAGITFAFDNTPYHLFRTFPSDYPASNIRRVVKAVTGACLAVRRSLFLELGGFDENYLNGMEDVDFCLRVQKLGLKVLYDPRSTIYHFESQSKGRFDHAAANRERFLGTWKSTQLWDDYLYFIQDRALSKEDPNGLHIIIHYTKPLPPTQFFMQLLRQFFQLRTKFRFSILKPFSDMIDNLVPLFAGSVEVFNYTSRPFSEALHHCISSVEAPNILHLEGDRFFFGNLDKLLEHFRTLTNAVVQIPCTDQNIALDNQNIVLSERTEITQTMLLFNKHSLVPTPNLKYPDLFLQLSQQPHLQILETQTAFSVNKANQGL